ncbi:MAG: sigma-70 family RNA polymerase sigma factor [Actinomycetota bacterium]|nr:sigma-70 family RNA polymerase sigma factor [Actinomycetota bacterium]
MRGGMKAVSDEALLAGLASGDHDAASEFVSRYQRRVFGLASTIVRDRGLAEDVAQEAFVRAWRHAASYDPRRGTVTTWLLAITRNLAIDTLRVRRPTAVDPDVLPGLHIACAHPSPDETPGLLDDAAPLRAAIGRLPEEQRRALIMAGLLGHTAREVSETEGIPLGTAKTRIRTALLRLRALLRAEEPEDHDEELERHR